MRGYFDGFLSMAAGVETGFVLDTNTWRGGAHWGPKLDKSEPEMLRLNLDALNLAKQIRADWQTRVSPILLNGVIGPSGDGYAPGKVPEADEAHDMHRPQIKVFADGGADMVSAITMTNSGEAIGIVRAAVEEGLPIVVSFTLETDGRLPTGQFLGDAINSVDQATEAAPIYYMINCAHPDHFRDAIATGAEWVNRIGGVRANASRLSHAELDVAESLDDGDPVEFGQLHSELIALLPNLKVVGGCCGTDHRHVSCVSQHVHFKSAA